jgi:hypothetical protein
MERATRLRWARREGTWKGWRRRRWFEFGKSDGRTVAVVVERGRRKQLTGKWAAADRSLRNVEEVEVGRKIINGGSSNRMSPLPEARDGRSMTSRTRSVWK